MVGGALGGRSGGGEEGGVSFTWVLRNTKHAQLCHFKSKSSFSRVHFGSNFTSFNLVQLHFAKTVSNFTEITE